MSQLILSIIIVFVCSINSLEGFNIFDPFKQNAIPESTKKDIFNPFSTSNINGLEDQLKEKVFGQDDVIRAVVKTLQVSSYGLQLQKGPIASFLFVGPSGVGKSKLAFELSRILLENEEHFIRFNMTNFSDPRALYSFIGVPRGIPGYDGGGIFTEALQAILKESPHAIVLFDNLDKASSDVLEVLSILFESGIIYDNRGSKIDCRKCLFLATSNHGSQEILTLDDLGHTQKEILKEIGPALKNLITDQVYSRMQIGVFRGFKGETVDLVITNILDQYFSEIGGEIECSFTIDPSVVEFIKVRSSKELQGAFAFIEAISAFLIPSLVEAVQEDYLTVGQDQEVSIYCDSETIYIHLKDIDEPFSYLVPLEEGEVNPPFEFDDILDLDQRLAKRVLGQEEAIEKTVSALVRYAAGFRPLNSPIGSFLFIGPTGVGKTQLAKELAIELLGSAQHLIRFDMSEYSESHSISRLIGSPPGYIAHYEGGQLTEALKKHPYAVVLLDEIEKAHPNVLKTFLQVFDEGRLSDAQGTLINCRNVLFILTTNLAASQILALQEEGYDHQVILEVIRPMLFHHISPELFNRLEPVLFNGISVELMDQLVEKMLGDVQADLLRARNIHVTFDQSIHEILKANGFDYELGARPLKRLIQQAIVMPIAAAVIERKVERGDHVMISYENGRLNIQRSP